MDKKRKRMRKEEEVEEEEQEERWKGILGYIKSDDDFSETISEEITKKRKSNSNYDENRSNLIQEFQREGFDSRRGVRAWVEKEMEELMHKGIKTEKSNVNETLSPTGTYTGRNRTDKKPSTKKKKPNNPPGDVPLHIRKAIEGLGGTHPVWLIAKGLTNSDINQGLSRLLFPRCCDETIIEFMTSDERKKETQGVHAKVVDPRGEIWDMDFKHWDSLNGYVLNSKNWKKLVAENLFDPKTDVVQVWMFRSLPSAELCFAINIDRTTPEI